MPLNKYEIEREPCVIEAIYLLCATSASYVNLLSSDFVCIAKYN